MRCPKCGGYRFDNEGNCLTPKCGYNMNPITPRTNLGEADIFKLADGLYATKKIEKPVESRIISIG